MDNIFYKLKTLSRNSDLFIALGILIVLSVMVIPVPPLLLDLLLTSTLSFTVIVLLVSVYTKKPLEFSTFPSVLLVMTLFRLSLNVASTRNILLGGGNEGTGAAGEIIKSFGEFVVQGNYVVGIIVFSILVIINFVVITKGAGRVAEVAARFTLDAMPGKQMAIDADLNAGLINEEQARERRREVAEEADFYGAMDGASKFVRGDAIAGILITAINIIGGIIVGVAQNDMLFSDAAQTFTLLTVGDGLVTQIPALILSTAAGIIITRNTSSDNLGAQVGKQFKVHPKAMYMASGVLFIFALIPGLPGFPFFTVGGAIAAIAWKLEKNNKLEKETKERELVEKEEDHSNEKLEDLLALDLVELNVGYGLVSLVDSSQSGDLLERISHIRRQFATDWGIIVPQVKIRDDLELAPASYQIKIKGMVVASGELRTDYFLAMDPGNVIEKIEGIETTEPVFGLPAVWIAEDLKEDAGYYGYTVVDTSTIIATHLTEILKTNLHELLGRQELINLLDSFKQDYPKIISDLIPDILPLGPILKVLQNLLKEGVPIRDLRTILESLAEYGEKIKDPSELTEHARKSLYRTITESVKGNNNDIPIYTLDRQVEETIASNLVESSGMQQLALDPKITQSILASLNDKIEEATEMGEKMVVLCSPIIRTHFKRLTEKFIPNLTVISHNEINPETNIRSLGTVRI